MRAVCCAAGGWGAGDVAGVFRPERLSDESERVDGVGDGDGDNEEGESRVSVGEPVDVNVAGRSVALAGPENRPFKSLTRILRRSSARRCVEPIECGCGGDAVVNSEYWVLSGSIWMLGTGIWILDR